MTSHFNGPHGQAVSLTLPDLLVFTSETPEESCNDPRGSSYVKKTIDEISSFVGAESPAQGRRNLLELFEAIGLKTKLSDVGIVKNQSIETIIEGGFTPSRVKNNPRSISKSELSSILSNIL